MSKMEKEPLFSAKNLKYLTGPFSANNPVIVQILGICSALAVTVQLKPAIVMALSVTVVTAFSNLVMSLLRNGVPSRIRIIVQLVVIAALVIWCHRENITRLLHHQERKFQWHTGTPKEKE